MKALTDILGWIYQVASFVPTAFTWLFNTFVQLFVTIAKFKSVFNSVSTGQLTRWFIPIDYFQVFAPLVGLILFFGLFKVIKKVF